MCHKHHQQHSSLATTFCPAILIIAFQIPSGGFQFTTATQQVPFFQTPTVFSWCPKSWQYMEELNKCVHFTYLPTTRVRAILDCGNFGKGSDIAELMEFNSQEDYDVICSVLERRQNLLLDMWIGVDDMKVANVYKWNSSGMTVPPELTRWDVGEPDGSSGHVHCVVITRGCKWKDVPCVNKFAGFVCQISAVNPCKIDNGGCRHYCEVTGIRKRVCQCPHVKDNCNPPSKSSGLCDDSNTAPNSTMCDLCKQGYTQVNNECRSINPCRNKNGGCSQLCIPTVNNTGVICKCRIGYKSINGTKCYKINPCGKNNGGCSQLCIPTVNSKSVICKCRIGFKSNGTKCYNESMCEVCSQQCVYTSNTTVECQCNNGYEIVNQTLCYNSTLCRRRGGCDHQCIVTGPNSKECGCNDGYYSENGTKCILINDRRSGHNGVNEYIFGRNLSLMLPLAVILSAFFFTITAAFLSIARRRERDESNINSVATSGESNSDDGGGRKDSIDSGISSGEKGGRKDSINSGTISSGEGRGRRESMYSEASNGEDRGRVVYNNRATIRGDERGRRDTIESWTSEGDESGRRDSINSWTSSSSDYDI